MADHGPEPDPLAEDEASVAEKAVEEGPETVPDAYEQATRDQS